MSTLTLALPPVRPLAGTEFDYVLSDDGQAVLGHGTAPLGLLPAAGSLVLVVPARCLSWHAVKLPPLAANRLRQALEGILEDALLDEPGNLALAVGPGRALDGISWVAACDKSWLRSMLEFFELAKRPASRVIPQFAPVGSDPAQRRLQVTGSARDAQLALVDTDGVLCGPLDMAAELLGAARQGFEGATVFVEPALAELAEQVLARPVTIQTPAEGLLASSRTDWELAQFDLAISSGGRMARRWGQAWKEFARAPGWRAARWGVSLLLLANLVGLNAWAWRQETTLQTRREQVRGLLSQTFPKVRTIVDAPLQMERELGLLRQTSGALSGSDLEVMLGAVGSALPTGLTPTAINYSPGELVLKGLGLKASQAAQVGSKLQSQSYTARIEGEHLVVRAGAGQ